MDKRLTRAQLIEILSSVSQVTLTHSSTCTSNSNGECYCEIGDHNELRTKVREALKVESPQLAEQVRALEAVEAAQRAYEVAFKRQQEMIRATPTWPAVLDARKTLLAAQAKLLKVRSDR